MVDVTLSAITKENCAPWASFDDIRMFFENSRVLSTVLSGVYGLAKLGVYCVCCGPCRAGLCHNLKEVLAK